ncbi:MAG: transposase YhgA family protein [Candidatus Magnetoglobus multicellularis str. Araruama]|uniref:Transposase YhgA family protein n=1 Tax=Candidatus Magnetoglobus multicellularis str. Araruama TaxID=890399 RepID=A0A1V1NUM3_9BACT|nr:MAG: transposase YhgA family protein [Candidatus Magnetoglobus multicellularis str. Araruama]
MSQIINPHAMFFEKVFSRKDVAVDLVQNYLPKEIINDLDLPTLQLENKSFISNELKSSQSDLLFKVLTKDCNAVFIYFLLEHKSFVDRWVMLQLLEYIIQICDEQRAINKQKRKEIRAKNIKNEKPENEGIDTEYLYPIIPVVFYHGKAEWNLKKDFSELFHKGYIYKKYLPDYTFELINTANYSDDQFKGNVILRVSLMALKHFFMNDFETKVPDLLCLLADLIDQIDSEIGFLEVLLRYLSVLK